MSEQTAIVIPEEKGMSRIKNYLLAPEVTERFAAMMGKQGMYYLNQVLIVVANSERLQQSEPRSILTSAMRAASLRLSVDISSGQAWIIAYKNNKTGKLEAQFQLGYKGIYELAMRTNQYRFINMIPIYQGETTPQDRMTGMHRIEGERAGDKVIAWMLYFKLLNGFEKTFLMTIEEIAAHGKRYAPSYNDPKSKWNTDERWKMERKTVLSNGLRQWGRFNEDDKQMLDEIEDNQGWNDREMPEEDEVTHTDKPRQTEEKNMVDLGFEPDKPTPPAIVDPETGEVIPAEPIIEGEATPAPKVDPLRYQPETLILKLLEASKKQTGPANGKRGLVVAMLDAILSSTTNPTESRHQLLKYLTGKASSKDIPDNMMLALYKWLNPKQDSGGEWQPDTMAVREALAAFVACQPKQDALI